MLWVFFQKKKIIPTLNDLKRGSPQKNLRGGGPPLGIRIFSGNFGPGGKIEN